MSVVLAGILINLAAAYLKPLLDSQLSAVSSWWATRVAEQESFREQRVVLLSRSAHEQVMTTIEALRLLIFGLIALVSGVFVMLFGRELLVAIMGSSLSIQIEGGRNAVAGACLFVSFLVLYQAAELRRLLDETRTLGGEVSGD